MAQLTLEQMLRLCARYTDNEEELTPEGGPYTGEALILANKFITSLNYATGKIVREKFIPSYTEPITLDANYLIDVSTLTYDLIKIISIEDVYGTVIGDWVQKSTNQYKITSCNPGDTLYITYGYLPADLNLLVDTFPLPRGSVDPKIPCYYAAYEYYIIENDFDLIDYYNNLWLNGFRSISQNTNSIVTVKRTGESY